MKRIFTTILALTLLCSTALAAQFTDVPATHVFYDTISQAVESGLFNGTSDTIFNPSGSITRKQFLVVTTRALGLTDSSDYDIADSISKLKTADILTGGEYFIGTSVYGQAMTREEMAYVMGNVLVYTGEELNADIDTDRIPDYSDIGTACRDQVVTVYSNGILMGTDDAGTFNPDGNLTRGAAAAVIMRLVEPSNRSEVLSDAEYAAEQAAALSATVQTIYEGINSYRLPAKVGDIYVKADGTTVTLVRDSNNVLMGSDGSYVAADLGMKSQVDTVRRRDAFNFEVELNGAGVYEDYYGNSLQNQTYYVLTTGMGIWGKELDVLQQVFPTPSYSGTEGEISSDMYSLYRWSDPAGCWGLNG